MTRRREKFWPRLLLLVAAAGLAAAPSWCVAHDVLLLKSGGRVRGQWLNRDETPRKTYVIQTDAGKITLDRAQVERVVEQSPTQAKYHQLRARTEDTVAGHERLAKWCLEHRLEQERTTHLARILELDPDHAATRAALGYRQVGGRWMTREETMASRGMKLYKGRYRSAQEIQIIEAERKAHLAERGWYRDLKRWRSRLVGTKAEEAAEKIQAIRDPSAVKALVEYLKRDELQAAQLLYIEALASIDAAPAMVALVDQSLDDPDNEIRLTCLDQLIRKKHPSAVHLYIKALKHKDNVRVRRAAVALKALGDTEALVPLIDALVTRHKYLVSPGNEGEISTAFTPTGGGGYSFGNKGPTIVNRDVRNEEVLSALTTLSNGQNFSYDERQWRSWYAQQQKVRSINTRRD